MFIIVDNRFIPTNGSFDLEASISQYHRLNSVFVGKYATITQAHSLWSQPISGLVYAKAPEKSVLIGGDYCTDPLKINSYLEPKFHLRLDHSTWEYYLCDCIKEIAEYLSKLKQTQAIGKTLTILILSNHMSLGLHNDITTLRNGLTVFATAVEKLRQIYRSCFNGEVNIQILSIQLLLASHTPSTANDEDMLIATVLNDTNTSILLSSSTTMIPQSTTTANGHMMTTLMPPTEVKVNTNVSSGGYMNLDQSYRIQTELSRLSIQFTSITNSSLYYDLELRTLLSKTAPKFYCKVNVPQVKNMHLYIHFELRPTTMNCADNIDIYNLNLGEPFSIVSRSGISPNMVEGLSLWVNPRAYTETVFNSYRSYEQNKMSFICLSKMLTEENTVLIIKFTVKELYDQYWALVPPVNRRTK